MDENMNNQQYGQTDMNQQYNQQYGQADMNQQYGQQYGQTDMNQQYNQQYGQQYGQQYDQGGMNQQYYGQQYGAYPQYARPSINVGESIKNVHSQFKGRVSRMGLSVYCLLGIIGAMLLIVAPFMNFASIHVNEEYEYEDYVYVLDDYRDISVDLKFKASDGFNLFEISKASKTINDLADDLRVDTDDILDAIEDYQDEIQDELEDEFDTRFSDTTFNEVFGTAKLMIKGRAAALITPWILILCGLGLLIGTVINNKIMKLVCSVLPLVCLIWLIACSGHFFSIMGIGAFAIVVGIVLGIVSAIMEEPEYIQ